MALEIVRERAEYYKYLDEANSGELDPFLLRYSMSPQGSGLG